MCAVYDENKYMQADDDFRPNWGRVSVSQLTSNWPRIPRPRLSSMVLQNALLPHRKDKRKVNHVNHVVHGQRTLGVSIQVEGARAPSKRLQRLLPLHLLLALCTAINYRFSERGKPSPTFSRFLYFFFLYHLIITVHFWLKKQLQ